MRDRVASSGRYSCRGTALAAVLLVDGAAACIHATARARVSHRLRLASEWCGVARAVAAQRARAHPHTPAGGLPAAGRRGSPAAAGGPPHRGEAASRHDSPRSRASGRASVAVAQIAFAPHRAAVALRVTPLCTPRPYRGSPAVIRPRSETRRCGQCTGHRADAGSCVNQPTGDRSLSLSTACAAVPSPTHRPAGHALCRRPCWAAAAAGCWRSRRCQGVTGSWAATLSLHAAREADRTED